MRRSAEAAGVRWLVMMVLCCWAFVARAEVKSDAIARAKEEFQRGNALFDRGRFVEAAAAYKEAYRLSERPAFWFNIAQAYRLGGMAAEAVTAYRTFIDRVPESPQRAEAERRIAELKVEIEETNRLEKEKREREAANRPVPSPAQPTPTLSPKSQTPLVTASPQATPRRDVKPWVWGTIAAVVVVGVGLGVGLGLGLTRARDATAPAGVQTFEGLF